MESGSEAAGCRKDQQRTWSVALGVVAIHTNAARRPTSAQSLRVKDRGEEPEQAHCHATATMTSPIMRAAEMIGSVHVSLVERQASRNAGASPSDPIKRTPRRLPKRDFASCAFSNAGRMTQLEVRRGETGGVIHWQ